ncbi:MAG: hypothetical protein Q4D81_09240 [Eubacteriales bacterium]|nr:hypothetical protein [Eubacteriales bacterium]
MKALNLYSVTRVRESGEFSLLEKALSGRAWHRPFSSHEVDSLCALVERMLAYFRESGTGKDCLRCFDGFFFSYTIEHISKEFDLLKLSSDLGTVLNIELKSESIEEDRIRRQLEQNRYYLSHTARTILSFTYVMETDTLYCLNDHGYLKQSDAAELARALQRPALEQFLEEDIDSFFRARDYLISPVKEPERFLAGRYFLTNQQADFRRQILETLEEAGRERGPVPVISLTGSAGTGKTLLLLELAVTLSRRKKVLFLHGGPLREGHRLLDRRLHKVKICSGTETPAFLRELPEYAYILIDEANRFPSGALRELLEHAEKLGIPIVFSFDPHTILGVIPPMEDAEAVIAGAETLRLELSGNIRINRPVFSFLRTLFHQKDRGGHVDYGCIDILYAGSAEEEKLLCAYYEAQGYERLPASPAAFRSGEIISQEFDRVLMVMDRHFYYDDSLHLCADGVKGAAIWPLYEGLSRAREKLCLIITRNPALFSSVLAIRTQSE